MANLSQSHRQMAIAELERIEETLSQLSAWLDGLGLEQPAILIEDSWRNILAAQRLLQRDPAARARLVHGRLSGDGREDG